ncbi:winged helix-turn-helix domain-containing protein [Haloarcula litorea]|uniref:winged helix-turn-helix domain-containing protein n=1 Tax=Haloarcula litorea TaxID=3032579 RepID=UPI0023E88B43|nr:winged helix-turn-helix domain-containing protein [Halomicroarcula sp. GDY20]
MAAHVSPTGRGPRNRDDDQPTHSADELLELLGDEYTRRVLRAVADEARSVREAADVAAVSRSTAHRRLTTLADAGLVESRLSIDDDGHHRQEYRAVIERANLDVRRHGLDVDVTVSSGQAETGPADD